MRNVGYIDRQPPEREQHRHIGGPGTAGSQKPWPRDRELYLYDYQILPCLDCRRCKKDEFTCHLLDGMSEIYPRLEEADLIVFGTPVYWLKS